MTIPRLLFLLGPTASGKSHLAVEIAKRVAGAQERAEILNFDSVQFFAELDIGAAKPGPELLASVPHHLIGHLKLDQNYTAGEFRRDAIVRIESGPKKWIAVGGSGFYQQALEKGMYDVPQIHAQVRSQLAAEASAPAGFTLLYREFQTLDPEAAAKVSPNDRYRILRALEILRSNGGSSLSRIRAQFEQRRPPPPFSFTKIGLRLNREVLRIRITERTRNMLASGFIDEVVGLRDRGRGSEPVLHSVGYHEVQEMLDGNLKQNELESAIVGSTMRLAKKQMTWFKRDPSITWFDAQSEIEAAIDRGASDLVSSPSNRTENKVQSF